MNGFEVVKAATAWDATVPVIVISGGLCAADDRIAMGLGAFCCLSKPVNVHLLTQVVDVACGVGLP